MLAFLDNDLVHLLLQEFFADIGLKKKHKPKVFTNLKKYLSTVTITLNLQGFFPMPGIFKITSFLPLI